MVRVPERLELETGTALTRGHEAVGAERFALSRRRQYRRSPSGCSGPDTKEAHLLVGLLVESP